MVRFDGENTARSQRLLAATTSYRKTIFYDWMLRLAGMRANWAGPPVGLRNLRKMRILEGGEKRNGSMSDAIPASEFTRNFGRYRMLAQREAVAVSSHGSITGYFVGPDEYEQFRRFKEHRRSFATAELPDEKVRAIGASRMDSRHAHLDGMLDRKRK
ncbi:MAG TPA: hypothetical protein VH684_24410 [Xanthobacteraceae bacterium]